MPPRSAPMPAASSRRAPAPIFLRPPPHLPPQGKGGGVRLLVTRPERDGERTARALRGRGHEVVLAALMQIEPIADAQLGTGPWSGLVMTSANVLPAFAAHPRRAELSKLPLAVVGERTAA